MVLLPPPIEAYAAFMKLVSEGILWSDLSDSGSRYLPGFILGSALGVFAGVLTSISSLSGSMVNPLFNYLRSIPPVALIPFTLVLFGIDDAGKVSLVAWAVFFPVWLNTQAGINQVPTEYIQAAKIYGSNKLRRISDLWIPYSIPYIIGGLRISVATGIFALAAAEMFASSSGIGFRIVYSHQLFQTDAMVAMILFVGIIALCLDRLLGIVRYVVSPWERT